MNLKFGALMLLGGAILGCVVPLAHRESRRLDWLATMLLVIGIHVLILAWRYAP